MSNNDVNPALEWFLSLDELDRVIIGIEYLKQDTLLEHNELGYNYTISQIVTIWENNFKEISRQPNKEPKS